MDMLRAVLHLLRTDSRAVDFFGNLSRLAPRRTSARSLTRRHYSEYLEGGRRPLMGSSRTRRMLRFSNALIFFSIAVLLVPLAIYALAGIDRVLLVTALCAPSFLVALVVRSLSDPAYDYTAQSKADDPSGDS